MTQLQEQIFALPQSGSNVQLFQKLNRYQGMRPCGMPCQQQVRLVLIPSYHEEQAYNLMAQTYAMLQGQTYDKIILICSDRSSCFYGVGLPLTDDCCVPGFFLDTSYIDHLAHHVLCHYNIGSFSCNLQFETQQVFCRMYLPDVQKIIPLLVGVLSEFDAEKIAALIANSCSERTLIIMSADISVHDSCTHVCPLDQSVVCSVYDQDALKIQALQCGSFAHKTSLFDNSTDKSIFALLFSFLQIPCFHDVTSHFIGYQTSSVDQRKLQGFCVSYAACMYEVNSCGYRNQIGKYEQQELLQHARRSLHEKFGPCVCRIPCMMSYEMMQPHGVFSCIYYMSDHGVLLQGSYGKVEARLPLYDMVYQITQQAAFHDSRFYALQEQDLDGVIIALSVITDFTSVKNLCQIQPSSGVLLRYADRQAVSLPLDLLRIEWDYQSVICKVCQPGEFSGFVWKKPQVQIFTFHSLGFQED